MKKLFLLVLSATFFISCVSKKQYAELETSYNTTKQDLVDTKAALQKCEIEKGKIDILNNQIDDLKADKAQSLKQVENLTVLTQSASDNIKQVVAQLSEKRQVHQWHT